MPSFRPVNFSWVVDGLLSGCAFPSNAGHFQFLVEAGVRHLVTLTEFTPPLHLLPKELKFHHIPVEEFDSPSLQQMHQVHRILRQAQEKHEGVTVHCYWGLGRTGTMLAACLVALHGVNADDAVREIRRRRPFSIETYEQENAVRQFAQSLKSDSVKDVTQQSDESDD